MAQLQGDIWSGVILQSSTLINSTSQLSTGHSLFNESSTTSIFQASAIHPSFSDCFLASKIELTFFSGLPITTLSFLSFALDFNQPASKDFRATLNRLFGANARQDASKLYIDKTSLIGLTPQANNNAESLLIALLLTTEIYHSVYDSRLVINRMNPYLIQVSSKYYFKVVLLFKQLVPVSYIDIGSSFSELNFEIREESSNVFLPNNF